MENSESLHPPLYAVWIRNTFRFHDHQALHKAFSMAKQKNGHICFVFSLHPDFLHEIDLHHDYFFRTLEDFCERCHSHNFHVHIIQGDHKMFHTKLTDYFTNLKAVFTMKERTPFAKERDSYMYEALNKKGIDLFLEEGNHIHPSPKIKKEDHRPYLIFTPYFRKWIQEPVNKRESLSLEEVKTVYSPLPPADLKGENFFYKEVLSRCKQEWKGIGEETALGRLEDFINVRLRTYEKNRDYPGIVGTSRLSPYIKTGALSIGTVFREVYEAFEEGIPGSETYLKELVWRDFYAMIYDHYPETYDLSFKKKYRSLSWHKNEELLYKWQTGQTGFPIIDAAMRQLNQTGWMHNRLRMVTASFLVKDYLLDWRLGERYFARKLIDYDEASNVGGWQWASSIGTDAVPYFRIFNPFRQSERFDSKGIYIRKFVPELEACSGKEIHEPFKNGDNPRASSYLKPSVDHREQRLKAINLFKYAGEDENK